MALKLLLDLDTGIDDTLALSYVLASPEVELVGVSSSYGNVTVQQATQNNLDLLALYGAECIPVVTGAECPLIEESFEPDPTWHGANGTGNATIPAKSTRQAESTPAAEFIVDAVRTYGDDLRIVATGPSTNVATAIKLAPELAPQFNVVMMGGSLTQPGNMNDFAECNAMTDPEALDFLFKSGARVTVVGLDVTMQGLMTKEDTARLRELGTPKGTFLADAVDYYIDISEAEDPAFLGGCNLHDPLAAAVAMDPGLVGVFPISLKVDLEGEARGRIIGDANRLLEQPKVTGVALAVDAPRFKERFMGRLLTIAAK